MATPIILPKAGNSVESCIIQSWHKQVGDAVKEGDVVCEVETDKAVMEVTAPADGTMLAIFFEVDDEAPVLSNIAALGDAGEDASSLAPTGESDESPAEEPQAAAVENTSVESTSAQAAPAPVVAAAADTGVGSSPRARAAAAKAGVSLDAVAGSGPNGLVIERDVANAPRMTPAAAAAVAAGGVAPATGTGPGGLIVVEDILPAGSAAASSAAAGAPAVGEDHITTIPVKGIRKVIADRMMNSLQSAAQLTLQATVKATSLQQFRRKAKAQAEILGLPNITIGDMINFAVVKTLARFPELNAHFLGKTIEQHSAVHLGVAVDTERGLLVPVLRHAETMSLAQLSESFKPLAKQAQDGSIEGDLLSGSTFTVTNLGNLGIDHFTPVLNVPEVAILGVGGLQVKPFRNAAGEVEFIDSIALSLTIDHQALDGAPAARFLQALVAAIEHFDLTLAQ